MVQDIWRTFGTDNRTMSKMDLDSVRFISGSGAKMLDISNVYVRGAKLKKRIFIKHIIRMTIESFPLT